MDMSKTQSPRRERHRNENMGMVMRRECVDEDEEAGLIWTMARTTGTYVDKIVSGRLKLVGWFWGGRKSRDN